MSKRKQQTDWFEIIVILALLVAVVLVFGGCYNRDTDPETQRQLNELQTRYNNVCAGYDTLPACVSAKQTLKEFGR